MAGTLVANTINTDTGLFSTQNAYLGIAKAWVNFTGTTTINGSFNVSSITYNATGDYTVNFTTAMANANYCAVTCSDKNLRQQGTPTTTTFECINAAYYGASQANVNYGYVAIFSS